MAKKVKSDDGKGNLPEDSIPVVLVDKHSSAVLGVQVSFQAPKLSSMRQVMTRITQPEQQSCESGNRTLSDLKLAIFAAIEAHNVRRANTPCFHERKQSQ